MTTVGVRELKNRLSYYLDLARRGERVVVTERGVPVAVLRPIVEETIEDVFRRLAAQGRITWGGGKPKGASSPVKVTGRPVSEILLGDRGGPLP